MQKLVGSPPRFHTEILVAVALDPAKLKKKEANIWKSQQDSIVRSKGAEVKRYAALLLIGDAPFPIGMLITRTSETRRVRFRWRVQELVWCWSRSDRVRPLVLISPRPPTRMPIESDLVWKRPQNTLTSRWWVDFRGIYIFWLFSSAHQSFFLRSCRLQYLCPPSKNGIISHLTLGVRVFV